ncbi:MAG: 16S rRNA (cytosine(1402)-N(4))-methyltransferase RsmH [Cryomorphaceae bacterium]|nr:MAG: 16S rRNA (cytosine(1402)-N(4))-methyltransferase RsmH [Cryomorphaceae bacterium]
MYHNPVLLEESIDSLKIKKNGVYVDLTFGGGGHSKEILKRLNKEGKIIAFDTDEDALQNQINDSRFIFLRQNFIYLMQNLSFFKIKKIDGLIADLGVSSHQFDIKERGFSYEGDNELDMRMDVNQNINAIKIVNTYSEQKLADLFFYNGDLTNSRRISKLICDYRKNIEIKNSNQLNDSLKPILNKGYENKFLARIYQSLRIEVNDEIGCLKKLLNQIPKVLKPNGIASIITYHSIEDRLVKRFFKNGNFNKEPEKDEFGNIKTIFKIKKFIKPNDLEIKENPRSRSAKLRVAKLI